MKKIVALAVAAGLAVSACAKHDADDTAAANADLATNDADLANSDVNSGGVLAGNDAGNVAVPADEGNGTTVDAGNAAAGNAQ